MPEPRRDRPVMPKDYGVPEDDEGLLPWSHVAQRMEAAKNYWVATVRPDRRPHVSAVWGAWLDDTLYFDGSPQTRRGRNIAANPHIAVHLESAKDVVILEGTATEITPPDRAFAERLAAAITAKYAADGYTATPETWNGGGLWRVRHRLVIAFTQFPKDATRWRFAG